VDVLQRSQNVSTQFVRFTVHSSRLIALLFSSYLLCNKEFANLTLNPEPLNVEPVNAYGKSLLFGMFLILFEPFDQISI